MAMPTANAPSASPATSSDLEISKRSDIERAVRNLGVCSIEDINPSETGWTVRIFCPGSNNEGRTKAFAFKGLERAKVAKVAMKKTDGTDESTEAGWIVTLTHHEESTVKSFDSDCLALIGKYISLAQKEVQEQVIPGTSEIRQRVSVASTLIVGSEDENDEDGGELEDATKVYKLTPEEERIVNFRFKILTLILDKNRPDLKEIDQFCATLKKEFGLRIYPEEKDDCCVVSIMPPKNGGHLPRVFTDKLLSFPYVIF